MLPSKFGRTLPDSSQALPDVDQITLANIRPKWGNFRPMLTKGTSSAEFVGNTALVHGAFGAISTEVGGCRPSFAYMPSVESTYRCA